MIDLEIRYALVQPCMQATEAKIKGYNKEKVICIYVLTFQGYNLLLIKTASSESYIIIFFCAKSMTGCHNWLCSFTLDTFILQGRLMDVYIANSF